MVILILLAHNVNARADVLCQLSPTFDNCYIYISTSGMLSQVVANIKGRSIRSFAQIVKKYSEVKHYYYFLNAYKIQKVKA